MTVTDKDVNSDSSAENQQDGSSSSSNKSVSPERSLENVMAENRRKAEEIKELREKSEAYETRISELEELARERELTKREEAELSNLNTQTIQVDSLVSRLESQQDEVSIAWKALMDKKVKGTLTKVEENTLKLIFDNECDRQNDFLEDKVVELNASLKDGEERYTIDSLAKALNPYGKSYKDKRPERKAQLAFRDWMMDKKRLESIEERERKIKEREEADLHFRETGRQVVRDSSLEKKFQDSKDKSGLMIDVLDQAAALRKKAQE